MAGKRALAAAVAVALLAVAGAGGAGAQTPKRGGTVAIPGLFAGTVEPACLNPFRSCGLAVASDHLTQVLLGAFENRPDGLRPRLVSRVEVGTKPPFTLTYRIRPDARWSDGVAVTARDFVFTHRTIRRHTPEDVAHGQVRSVRALDAKTVRVELSSRFSGWRSGLFYNVLPAHALRGVSFDSVWTDRIDDPRTGAPIASGPFLVERWDRGSALVLRRNNRYWGPHLAYLDRLVMRFGIDDPVEALRAGRLDVYEARLGLNPEVARDLLRVPGTRHRYMAGFRFEHFEFRLGHGGHPALGNKLVRQALAYGIDRGALLRGVFAGVPGVRPADSAVFLPSSADYRPNWSRYRHRPVEARRLLEQAGCRRQVDGIYGCAGERLSLRFVANAGVESRSRALALVQTQLRRAGIEVVPSFAPGSAVGRIITSGEWDVWIIAYNYFPDQPVDFAFRCQGPANFTGYCQRLVTAELDQANRILDPAAYARALNRADVQMARDVPVLPLWQEPSLAVFRSNIRGFVPSEPIVAWNAENWWLER